MSRDHRGPYRLEQGGQIDRSQQIPFRFNGRNHQGYAGDTLASALLANGVRTVARSLKLHRPRGIYSCGVEEPNGLLQLQSSAHAIPSARAPLIELTAGLEAYPQAGWPSVNWDLGRLLELFAPLWAAGFYNKTFIWPSWHTYEPLIRHLAGLGKAPSGSDPDRYEVRNHHCDVLVIGAGIAGLSAALEAARGGARVMLVEQDRVLGGQAAWDGSTIEGFPAKIWIERIASEIRLMPDVTILTHTTAVAYHDHNVVALWEQTGPNLSAAREQYWIAHSGRVILATGAIEQPLVFDNNDRPGIFLAGSMRQYLRRYAVAPGHRVLLATNNDSTYALADDLKKAGVDVLAVVDTRSEVPQSLCDDMRTLSIEVLLGCIPIDTAGFCSLKRVAVGRLTADRRSAESARTFICDALGVSGGWSPALHLYAQNGGKLAYDETSGALQPVTKHPSIEIVGSAAAREAIGPRLSPTGNTRRQWVDLLHDVTVADLELANRENYTSIEHTKRYTTTGMAADQGKTSTVSALEVIANIRGVPARALGHTTMRPPFMPVTLGAMAGREIGERFAPARLLPMHAWHVAHGALLQDFSEWQRPVAYVQPGESRSQAGIREAYAVRTAAGLFDGSSFGKIEIHGPDALEFLDRFYINKLAALEPGRIRYAIMLRETGAIFDDGTVVALAPDRLLITTTSGNASRVFTWLEEWHQTEWPQLRVAILPVTEQWATLSLAGPKARSILSRIECDFPLEPSSFPHLTLREGRIMGAPARIHRVSFTGEITYEISVPADAGPRLWEALIQSGSALGLQPLGLDALLLLRLEKGFLHIGTETDGTTIPDDVGWGNVAAAKSRDFIGKRSLSLPENRRPDRLQLVGLTSTAGVPFIVGSHLRLEGSFYPTDGWITSAGSAVLTKDHIALALLRSGRNRVGALISVYDAGKIVTRAQVVRPPFYDPIGDRMNG